MSTSGLLSPITINTLVVRNRAVMPSMLTNFATKGGDVTERLIHYYAERAKGGVGLVSIEGTAVEPRGTAFIRGISAADDSKIKGLSKLAKAIKAHGARASLQLIHGGRCVNPAISGFATPMVSYVPRFCNHAESVVLDVEDIEYIIDAHAQVARRVREAGFDMLEIHGAHGYLLQQFMSPYTNKRTDEYGGSMENRCRFIVRILKGIREVVEPGFVVGARINGNDFVEGGNDQDACVEIAKYLEPYVDYFNVSCGVYASAATMIEPCYSPEGWRSGFVKAIKSQVSVPIIAVNTVKHPQFAEQLLEEGVSDFVGMSRMHIADPYLVQKTMAGREDLIRKCLGCMNCNKSVVAGRTLHCALNPVAGHEVTFGDDKLVKNGNGRKVAIVGGGPAGMQAALLMKKRGFEPVIFEASGTLGGSAILASKAPCKHMAQEFVDTQIAEMQEYGIEVHLNTPGTVARIQTLEPYCVVVACGGNQIIPGVPGADRDNVYYIEDVLLGKVQFAGKKIAVIGGGHVGLEVAHYLCADNQVTVVEMQKEVGTSIYRTAKYKLLSLLQENGVEILTQHALAGVGEGTVALKQLPGGETVSVDADIVIMALGNRPDKAYEDKLAAAFDKVIVVGDATKAGTMADATKAAYEKCFYI